MSLGSLRKILQMHLKWKARSRSLGAALEKNPKYTRGNQMHSYLPKLLMKSFMKMSFTINMVALALAIAIAPSARADSDVYNFYFQKAPGPQTVIQGGPQQPASVTVQDGQLKQVAPPQAPVQGPASSGESVAAKMEKPADAESFYKWALALGYGHRGGGNLNSWSTGGLNIAGNYRFNKYVSLDASLLFPNKGSTFSRSGSSSAPSNSERAPQQRAPQQDCVRPQDCAGFRSANLAYSPYEQESRVAPASIYPSFGVRVTPVRINVFSWDLMEFSLLGGVTYSDDPDNRLSHYAGIRYGINIGKNFAIEFEGKAIPQGSGFQSASNLAWSF